MTFSETLKRLRAASGLSQAKFAKHISPDLSPRTLQAWEYGAATPPKWAQGMIFEAAKKNVV